MHHRRRVRCLVDLRMHLRGPDHPRSLGYRSSNAISRATFTNRLYVSGIRPPFTQVQFRSCWDGIITGGRSVVQYTVRQSRTSIFQGCRDHALPTKFRNPLVVRQHHATRQIDSFDHRVPLPVPECFHVSLTTAHRCHGANPHASRQLPTDPTAVRLPFIHRAAFFVPSVHSVQHCHSLGEFCFRLDRVGDVDFFSDEGGPDLCQNLFSHDPSIRTYWRVRSIVLH